MLSGDFVFDISLLQTILFALFAIMTLFQGRRDRVVFRRNKTRSRGIKTILAIVICCRCFQTTTFRFDGILSLSIERTVLFVIFRVKKTIYEVRVKNIRW
uniref:Uncharacterized protein n=1 Tax=Leptospira santarosai serovar Arenal str. MAVJ 401 TaxID=1049976 RepID=M6JIP0_9LEPT|nr:hypothetical protein LEP1GSC063_2590 [Leptospira santarosai serovar Arenal str. MAVJ 401]